MRRDEWNELVHRHLQLMARNPDAEFSKVHPGLMTAVRYRNTNLLTYSTKGTRLNPDNFNEQQMALLRFEKLYSDIQMRKFDMSQVRIERDHLESAQPSDQLYKFELLGLSKGQPKLCRGDLIILDDGLNKPEHFKIVKIVGDVLKFKWLEPSSRDILAAEFNMSLHPLNVGSKRCMNNLHDIQSRERIMQMLFKGTQYGKYIETDSAASPPSELIKMTSGEAQRETNSDIRLRTRYNDRQRQAITNIIEAKCRPKPYVLFGPPGTGKTATLIEATGQIFQRSSKAKVLLCAQTNNCADDLAHKLIVAKRVKESQVLRLCSAQYFNYLRERNAPIPSFFTPEVDVAREKRIVVTTNLMTPMLDQNFDYVFMDEASHASIPHSLLPRSRLKDEGCFVLSGDPKQLGPVTQSSMAATAGLGQSLLSFMFEQDAYGQHQGEYDPLVLTKLIVSYRCDPRLMEVNNKEFYKGELQFEGQTPADLLEKLNFERPLAFKRVIGKTEKGSINYTPSWKNELEADECVNYIFKLYWLGLKPDQVGVITYYSLQKAVIMDKFDERLEKERAKLNAHFNKTHGDNHKKSTTANREIHEFNQKKLTDFKQQSSMGFDWHCKIDTVDAFQGNERDVIIISTTKTARNQFLDFHQRFNVATSRSRWCTILVGHPDVETFGKYWKKVTRLAYRA